MQKPASCLGCPLYEKGTGWVPAENPGRRIMILGEAAGEHEARLGRPFVGASGGILGKAAALAGLRRENFVIDNVVRCRPPSNWLVGAPWEYEAIHQCSANWRGAIERHKPAVIVALGATAARSLLGHDENISNIAGYVFESEFGWVIPFYHPSFILQGNQALIGLFRDVLVKAKRIASQGFSYDAEDYVEVPTLDEVVAYGEPAEYLAVDIETGDHEDIIEGEELDASWEIKRCSFSNSLGRAVSFPWTDEYVDIARRVLAGPTHKLTWNGRRFDVPRLQAAGCPPGGRHTDLMDAWKYLYPGLPDELKPNRLGSAAPFFTNRPRWKHLSTRPEYYSCVDADVTFRGKWILEVLRDEGRLQAFERDCELWPLLEQMSANGVPVDVERLATLEQRLLQHQAEIVTALQAVIPEEIKPWHPKEGYKKEPKVLGSEHFRLPSGQWAKRLPFNPGSEKQIKSYMRYRRHPVPRDPKTDKETTGAEFLKRYSKRYKDPVYERIVDYKAAQKITSTYIYEPSADGRLHTTYVPLVMNRIGSKNPNLQNVPKRGELPFAADIRRCFRARPGYLLVEVDYSGIEALLVGYFARDANYIRIARLGIHTYVAGRHLGVPIDLTLPDEALRPLFAGIKREAKAAGIYDRKKRVVHASNYLLTPRMLHRFWPEDFASEKAAEAEQRFYFGLFPQLSHWQFTVVDEAHRKHFLQNPFGYRLWLWDVKHWDGRRQKEVYGEDAKRAVAFLPQSTGAGILKESILGLRAFANQGLLLLPVHDSLLLEVPSGSALKVGRHVKAVMERPIAALGGISVGTVGSIGEVWLEEEMEEF